MKKFLIDDIKFTLFHANNAPSCEICGYHQANQLATITSIYYQENISICEDCECGIRRVKNGMGDNLFIIKTVEKY